MLQQTWRTFLMATISPVSQSLAWYTTPKLPLPITCNRHWSSHFSSHPIRWHSLRKAELMAHCCLHHETGITLLRYCAAPYMSSLCRLINDVKHNPHLFHLILSQFCFVWFSHSNKNYLGVCVGYLGWSVRALTKSLHFSLNFPNFQN